MPNFCLQHEALIDKNLHTTGTLSPPQLVRANTAPTNAANYLLTLIHQSLASPLPVTLSFLEPVPTNSYNNEDDGSGSIDSMYNEYKFNSTDAKILCLCLQHESLINSSTHSYIHQQQEHHLFFNVWTLLYLTLTHDIPVQLIASSF